MRAVTYWLICMTLIGVMACNAKTEPPAQTMPVVMSVDAWKQLEPSLKFDGNTLEKLREDNAEFKSERQWSKFMKETVLPEMKRQTLTAEAS